MTNHNRLGEYLRYARERAGLTTRELAERSGLDHGTITRFEQGSFAAPRPDKLRAIAQALELPLGDVYAMAGYAVPTELPTFAPYLRAKYRDLPPDAIAELQRSFGEVAARYGYDGNGPAPGEDET